MMAPPSIAELNARDNAQDERLEAHSDVHMQLWEAIENLRDRLPLWATFLIGFLASLAGASLTLLGDIFIRAYL